MGHFYAKLNENNMFFTESIFKVAIIGNCFAIKLSSDFLQGSNIYKWWENILKFIVLSIALAIKQ